MARPTSANATEKEVATEVVDTDIIPTEIAERVTITGNIKVFEAKDYMTYSEANGRTKFGGEVGKKTKLTIEELRVLINEGWTPDDVKAKHGINDAELEQVVYELSRSELLPKPIKFGKKVIGA